MSENSIEIKVNRSLITTVLILIVGVLIVYNQMMISQISSGMGTTGAVVRVLGDKDASSVDLSKIKGTGYSIAALFPVEDIKTAQDAIDMIIPTGTPDYGAQLGVSYDDPVGGLATLVKLDRQVQLSGSENQRYLDMVTKPLGISCEFCCGVGPMAVRSDGTSSCGCQHNPALLGLTKWLIKNTDYTDGEIVKEALKWKALFFPKDMVELAISVAGGDTSSLDELPGMVGGC